MGSSTSTRNFGIRRFTNLVREGRLRAPSDADLLLGSGVSQNETTTTEVEVMPAGVSNGGGGIDGKLVGALWYEHDSQTYNDPAWGGAAGGLRQDLDTAPAGRMVQVLHGPGAKVWFRNTLANTTEPGLNYASARDEVEIVGGLGDDFGDTVAVGELLGWDDGNAQWAVTAVAAEAVFRVTDVDAAQNECDAEFLV